MLPCPGVCFEREESLSANNAAHILGEPGKQLSKQFSSLAPWAQNPAILRDWGLIVPSAARGLSQGQALPGAQHTEHIQSRQQQALLGNLNLNFKSNFSIFMLALL